MKSRSSSRVESVFTGTDFSMGYAIIEKCGLYHDNFREWFRKTRSDKTWSNFKAHFDRTFKKTQTSSRISKTKGYAAHVHAAQGNAALFTNMQQDHTLALANIATATQADRTLVALPTKTTSELSSQVAHFTAKLVTAQAKERPDKNRDIGQPRLSMDIGYPET